MGVATAALWGPLGAMAPRVRGGPSGALKLLAVRAGGSSSRQILPTGPQVLSPERETWWPYVCSFPYHLWCPTPAGLALEAGAICGLGGALRAGGACENWGLGAGVRVPGSQRASDSCVPRPRPQSTWGLRHTR